MALQRDNRVKVSALLHAGYNVSKVANLVGLAQRSNGSRSAWTIGKVSTDEQAVVERLLWIMTACGIPFEGKTVFNKAFKYSKFILHLNTFQNVFSV